MLALHEVVGSHGHIVAQIVEAEFVVCAICYVALVSAATLGRIGLMLVDAVDRRAMEHIKRPHPLRVALGEVVVHSYHMHTLARQRAKENRQCRNKCLTLAGSHFGDFALMQHDAADKLHIVVYHIPFQLVTSSHPVIFPNGFVAVDSYEIATLTGEFAVEVCGCYLNGLALGKSCGCFAYGGEDNRQMLVEFVLDNIKNFLLVCINLVPQGLTFFERKRFHLGTEFVSGILVGLCGRSDVGAYRFDAMTQAVVVELLYFGDFLLHSLKYRSYSFKVAARFIAKDLFKDRAE